MAGHRQRFGEGDVAHQPVFPSAVGHAVDADVDHRGPGLIQSPRTNSGLPMATTRISAWRPSAGRSRVREWVMVTVQSGTQQQPRHRASDQVRAADHHGVAARQSEPAYPAAASGCRAACTAPGSRAARPIDRAQPADIQRMEAVDILGRIDSQQHGARCRCAWAVAAAPGCRARCCRCSAERSARAARPRSCSRAGDDRSSPCRARPRACPCCGHRPGSPDPRRSTPSPGQALVRRRRSTPRRPRQRAWQAGRVGLAVYQFRFSHLSPQSPLSIPRSSPRAAWARRQCSRPCRVTCAPRRATAKADFGSFARSPPAGRSRRHWPCRLRQAPSPGP